MRWLLVAALVCSAAKAQSGCSAVGPNADYTYLVASGSAGAAYQWLVNGQVRATGSTPQLLHLNFDGRLDATGGQKPAQATGAEFQAGRWGQAVGLAAGGALSYPRDGNVDWNEGTLELWLAARRAGTDAVYSSRTHTLFSYRGANGDNMTIAQAGTSRIVYAGGTVGGQWESAYGGLGSMESWQAAEWHHIVFTWSVAANSMRFYVDGRLVADTNEKHYTPPAATGATFALGDDAYLVDEVRISRGAMDAGLVRASANRVSAPADYEVWLPVSSLQSGDRVVFQAELCTTPVFAYAGVPLTGADPQSTLLASGTTSVAFSVNSRSAASCGYSVGIALEYAAMRPFQSGQGGTAHRTTFDGLTPDPTVVNRVYVRCTSEPAYVLTLLYRSLPNARPRFPRKGNLWGSSNLWALGAPHAARTDLYLGADFTPGQIRILRAANPNILILTSINTVENSGLPEDYYLHDVNRRRIEVWPGTYRLNLTKPYVADYQAQYAYERLIDGGLLADGCFFDNFFTTQSWLKSDIYGNAVKLDANEDGIEDDPSWLDAAWREGVYRELNAWRKLMPHALASGHLPRPPQLEFSRIFNGDSIGFLSPQVADGSRAFSDYWRAYQGWWEIGLGPVITMIESAPPFQIGYGYGYAPWSEIPSKTLEFARTYYPYVRFGLAMTLMNDGFFAHEFGDTWHGNAWWYDELDFDLGDPLGPAARVQLEQARVENLIVNPGFEAELAGTWQLATTAPAQATVTRQTTDSAEGNAAVRIAVTQSDGVAWHVTFQQLNRALTKGTVYDVSFWAKADMGRTVGLGSQRNSPDWRSYGLSGSVAVTPEWRRYSVSFEANETVTDARIEFFVGGQPGVVWLDGVDLRIHPADVYRRDFTHGVALLNATRERQTIRLERGLSRIEGLQAPRHQSILDDSGPGFSASGEWRAAQYDSGMWKASGPYFHTWGSGCHQLDGTSGSAEWDLALREDGVYTIEAWWPAAPQRSTWSRQVLFEVIAAGQVLATASVDETGAGDQWVRIASLELAAADRPRVRVRNLGAGPAIADALHVYSASRYNDGSPASIVTLEPMDGIVLARDGRRSPPAKRAGR